MRLQLISVLVLLALTASAQDEGDNEKKVKLDDIEINILGSNYEQDGNHSPVTGGQGTELLDNIAPSITVVVPIDTIQTIDFTGGIDVYSSASSDNIDNPYLVANHISGESSQDTRVYGTLGYKRKNKKKGLIYGGSLGGSIEYDVASLQLSGSIAKTSEDGNREISIKGSYYVDNWKLIYPVELRNGNQQLLPTNIRHTGTLSVTGSMILSRRLQASISTDLVAQQGLLSTPFHRVYFAGDTNRATIENLPSQRLKLPIGLRLNYSMGDNFVLRTHYRYYWDTWGLNSHTINVELPVKVGKSLRFYPFYRYHTQQGVDYFQPFAQHTEASQFYTSDFDLSTLSSHKFGLGLSIQPLFGLARWKSGSDKLTMLKGIDLRYAHYERSDGLRADVGTVSLRFAIKR